MFSTSTVNVIHGEKFNFSFSTTHTLSPVVLNYVKAGFLAVLFYALVREFFIGKIPFSMPSFLLFWIFSSLFFSQFNNLPLVIGIVSFVVSFLVSLLAFLTPTMQTVFSRFTFLTLEIFKCCWKFPLTLGTAFRYNVHIRTSNIGFGQTPAVTSSAGNFSLCDYYNITTQKGV